jgi:hypothetical protein
MAAQPIKPEAVFTPAVPAIQNFVNRPDLLRSIDNAFRTPGKQIVLYGETGSGKTSAAVHTLLVRLQMPHVRVQCQPSYTTSDLISAILDEVNRNFSISRRSESIGFITHPKEQPLSPVYAHNPTPKALVETCGQLGLTVIIDDYEKTGDQVIRREVANLAKEFSDRGTNLPGRLVMVGIHESPGQMIRLDESLNRRLVQIQVPLFSDSEIRRIFVEGFGKLGIEYDASVIGTLVGLSGGYGGYAHDLGLRLAWEAMEREDRRFSGFDVGTVVERLLAENEASFGDLYNRRIRQDANASMQLRQLTCEAIALEDRRSLDVSEVNAAVLELVRRWWGQRGGIAQRSIRAELTKLLEPREGCPEVLIREGSKGNYRYRYRNMLFRAYVRWQYERRARGMSLR